MNTIDIIGGVMILLCATGGFFFGGIAILIETLQFITALLLVLSFKSQVGTLFSYFMTSQLLINIASVLTFFAVVYLVSSIAMSFLYKFLDPFKGLFLNKFFGLICGIITGFLLFYTIMGFLSTRDYFKTVIQKSYIYKISQ